MDPASGASPAQASESEPPVRVLYVVGWGRSGSTLLQRVLGQIKGWADCGEVADLWERGVIHGGRCGCGEHFAECSFWPFVLAQTFGDETIDAERFAAARASLPVSPSPAMWVPGAWSRLMDGLGDYPEVIARIYRAIQAVSGAEVVVDSSKDPRYARLLAESSAIDLTLVHLVRDPRATAWSWQRKLDDPGRPEPMPTIDPLRSSLLWDMNNVLAERLGRRQPQKYMRIRYEDLVSEPAATVQQIIDLAGSDAVLPDGLVEGSVDLLPTHSVYGNPNRFATGPTTFRTDDEWTRMMPKQQRKLVVAVTAPLFHRYGYRTVPDDAG